MAIPTTQPTTVSASVLPLPPPSRFQKRKNQKRRRQWDQEEENEVSGWILSFYTAFDFLKIEP